jgi:hypothetical protein
MGIAPKIQTGLAADSENEPCLKAESVQVAGLFIVGWLF